MPPLLQSFLEWREAISLVSCLAQFSVFASLAAAECLPLSAMFYNCYLAMCCPPHYPARRDTRLCICLAAGAWLSSFSFSTFTLPLAGPLTHCPGSRGIPTTSVTFLQL